MGAEFSAGRVNAAHAVEVIDVMDMGVGAAAEAFVQLCSSAGFTVVALGPSQFRAARARRPQWATITAILTAIFCGLGLLLLLVKRTESADAVIVEDRTGIQMRITGALPPELMAQIRSVVGERSFEVPYTSSFAPSVPVAPAAQAGTLLPPPVAPMRPAQPPHIERHVHAIDAVADTVVRRQSAVLILDDGRSIEVGAGAVVGRAPSPVAEEPSAVPFPVDDPSLSRTHVSFGPRPGGVWLVDHHSTNGTVVLASGARYECRPGERVDVPFGAEVIAGEVRMMVAAR